MHRLGLSLIFIAACVPAICQTSNGAESRPNQVIAQEVVISGTTTLSTTQVNEIANDLTSRRMGEDDEEIRARIQDTFQKRGYLDAQVTSLKVKPLDALARPKPVRIEADVSEGLPFKIQAVEFQGCRAMAPDALRKSFLFKDGELYSAGKLRSGLESLRKLYTTNGYLDFLVLPVVRKAGEGQLAIIFEITEGSQYRMGLLELTADKQEVADQLQLQWKLKKGEPFDASYPDKFIGDNRSSLPADFSANQDLITVRDCRDMTVAVYIQMDAKRNFRPRPKDAGCNK